MSASDHDLAHLAAVIAAGFAAVADPQRRMSNTKIASTSVAIAKAIVDEIERTKAGGKP